jgi:hypothetical protein
MKPMRSLMRHRIPAGSAVWLRGHWHPCRRPGAWRWRRSIRLKTSSTSRTSTTWVTRANFPSHAGSIPFTNAQGSAVSERGGDALGSHSTRVTRRNGKLCAPARDHRHGLPIRTGDTPEEKTHYRGFHIVIPVTLSKSSSFVARCVIPSACMCARRAASLVSNSWVTER